MAHRVDYLGQFGISDKAEAVAIGADVRMRPCTCIPIRKEEHVNMEDSELAKLVERHTVKYEVWRHWEIDEGKRIQVGFDLELHGTHDHGHTSLTAGCEHCQSTYRDLRSLAERVLPTEERPSSYDIEPFDSAFHSEARGPNEVVLVVRIHHRTGYFAPIDDCEERCLKEMEDRLRSLGAPGRHRH